jgi:hypothetical protein
VENPPFGVGEASQLATMIVFVDLDHRQQPRESHDNAPIIEFVDQGDATAHERRQCGRCRSPRKTRLNR